jgi:hypothetical protein
MSAPARRLSGARTAAPTVAAVEPLASTTINALPVEVDLNIYMGDDFPIDVAVTDSVTGGPMDLTGITAKSQIRATAADTNILATLTPTIAGNVITLKLSHTDSAKLPLQCVWDMQITDAAGNITTLVAGKVTVAPEVTRP